MYFRFWVVVVAILCLTVYLDRRDARFRRKRPGYCDQCGYNLTGNVSGRCPECGTVIDDKSKEPEGTDTPTAT